MEGLLIGIIGLIIIFGSMAIIHYREQNRKLRLENENLMWEIIDLREDRDNWKKEADSYTKAIACGPSKNTWDKATLPLTPTRDTNTREWRM